MKSEKQENQRNGRNKSTIINQSYIESGEYRKKFDNISNIKELNRLIYQLSKKILYHRSGSLIEDMYWIDADNIKVVASEIAQTQNEKISYSKKTKHIIKKQKHLITIHSHPNSFPPSIEDFNSNFENSYTLGVICCHDGKVYIYSANQHINTLYYKLIIEKFLKNGYNNKEAQLKTLEQLTNNYDIKWREVL